MHSQCSMPVACKQSARQQGSVINTNCYGSIYRLKGRCGRAVRTEASAVLGALVAGVGRGLAAALRPLAGPWWLAQFDPASEAARAAFQAAFPGGRQREALLFCRAQVPPRFLSRA